ncbi:MAG: phospholipase D family protein [Polyangiaceae bacterium]|nr:phospholipase D family protein [Polyangiaceae bacterium]
MDCYAPAPRAAPQRAASVVSDRRVTLRLVTGKDHYDHVIEAVRRAEVSVWIATANLKDVHVEARVGTRARARGRFESLMDELGELCARGVEVRILHSGAPSGPLSARLARGGRARKVELRRCVRVHMKMIAIDGRLLYLGSANFTGAGLGAKVEGRRNFEAGILTTDDVLLDRMQAELDAIWSGKECGGCRVRAECPRPLDGLGSAPVSGSSRSGSAAPARAAAASPPRGGVRGRRRGT